MGAPAVETRSFLPRRIKIAALLTAAIILHLLYSASTGRPLPVSESLARFRPYRLATPAAGIPAASSASGPTRPRPRIGKVSMLWGDLSPVYERALQSHAVHAQQHGYPLFVLREQVLDGLWSKHAYLFQLVSQELSKPADERLEWLFWFDADTVIVNPRVPLDIYLPPAKDAAFGELALLCGDDHHGLNDGGFLLRVAPYALHLLSTAMALPRFHPDISLPYTEQSAVELVVASPPGEDELFPPWRNLPKEMKLADSRSYFAGGRAAIPQRWLNAYVGAREWNGTRRLTPAGRRPRKDKANSVREGDMLVHFAGNGKEKRDRMEAFMDGWDEAPELWLKDVGETGLAAEVAAFWEDWKHETMEKAEEAES